METVGDALVRQVGAGAGGGGLPWLSSFFFPFLPRGGV
ncbi:hypothetical protein SFR_3001 [Streptomyces sp. FR-008]|nr:hypothetical protein SFR_3001 [Streptomyces sp. FR-008]